mmetsp:Transcript_32748/g.90456  ORF Transcript_32748/g.90456 Transcript_32748/m.90456 type:complete len:441 (-) Transcript_32748:72-1394(-)
MLSHHALQSRHQLPDEDAHQIILQGWLHKRGPIISYAWQRRWCVLRRGLLLYYVGEDCSEKKGHVPLGPSTLSIPFNDPGAPGDSHIHLHQRPFGFVISGTDSCNKPRVFHFDAGDPVALQVWTEALRCAACALPWTGTTSADATGVVAQVTRMLLRSCYGVAAAAVGRATSVDPLSRVVLDACCRVAAGKSGRGTLVEELTRLVVHHCYRAAAGSTGRGAFVEQQARALRSACYRASAGSAEAASQRSCCPGPSAISPAAANDTGRARSRRSSSRRSLGAKRLLAGLRSSHGDEQAVIEASAGLERILGQEVVEHRALAEQIVRFSRALESTDGPSRLSSAGLRDGEACHPTEKQASILPEYLAGLDVGKVGLSFDTLPPEPMIVKNVSPGMWAEGVGIEVGDQIVELNGTRTSTMTAGEFRKLIQQRPLCFRVKKGPV